MTELREMQQIVQAEWRERGAHTELHVGDLAWLSREPPERTRLWPERAFGVVSFDGLVFGAADGAHDDVLAWADGVTETWAMETDEAKLAALDRHGFRRAEGPFFVRLLRALDSLPSPTVAYGYALAHADDLARRVAVQRAAFVRSTMTEEKYARLLQTWPYRPELDVVVTAPDGSYASFALAWLDDENAVVELEPVGTDPDHARRGLARAASLEALRRARGLGAAHGVVHARGDDAYPAPLRLYRGLGFEPVAAEHRYVR